MFRLGHPVQQVHLHFIEISVPDLFDHCAYERIWSLNEKMGPRWLMGIALVCYVVGFTRNLCGRCS